jgi:hypothetical protein
MPSTKIFAVLIVCLAIVASVWIFEQQTGKSDTAQKAAVAATVEQSPIDRASFPSDWLSVDQVNGTTTAVVTAPYSGEGTVTDQVSKDFFSQYLMVLKENNGDVTPDQADAIAQKTLSSPEYLKATGVQYTAKDLHVSAQTSKEMVKAYGLMLSDTIKRNTPKKNVDELDVTSKAVQSGKEASLAVLDPTIAADQAIITSLLSMTIPSDAVQVHLAFVNAASNILSNTEAMRNSFADPIRSLAALSQFPQHQQDIQNALLQIRIYLKKGK